jgi:hypothetical protein
MILIKVLINSVSIFNPQEKMSDLLSDKLGYDFPEIINLRAKALRLIFVRNVMR